MVLKCEDIWREVSNYIDGDVDPQLKVAMEQHIAGCQKCRAVLAGSRNVVQIYGDDRAFRLPADFYPQLHRKLEDRVQGPGRRAGSAWILAVAAAILLAASVWVVKVHERPALEAHHTLSPEMAEKLKTLVVVTGDSKYFHLAGCPYIHGQTRTMFADEALREGLKPCDKCLKDLAEQLTSGGPNPDQDVASKDPAMDIDVD
jgi:hypothetical protein